MKYHIDTIPVWNAFKEGGECPLCVLQLQNENMYLDNFLGASVMEPDVRVEVNEKGFCARHFARMITAQNRLGLALMTHTHLKQTIETFEKAASALEGAPPKKLFQKSKENEAKAYAARMAGQGERCILCDRLDQTMKRYVYTTLHLWRTDTQFKQTFAASRGFCVRHFGELADMALEECSVPDRNAFLKALIVLERENLDRLEKELEWFTLKFDYRNNDKPWGTSKDALERAINKLVGRCVGEQ
ncbi:MAG TPA: DUF6062 family protein [Clostridia bacterium]|nr:DUF6062 family protein [Clostridia bacterium]